MMNINNSNHTSNAIPGTELEMKQKDWDNVIGGN